MAITKLKKFKINTHPSNEIGNTLAVGDIVHRQYFDGENVIYSLMYVHEVGTDTVKDKESGESKNSHFFIGSLLYGDAPKSGEVLEFVRITNLIDTDRAGAIYLTASDSESPYIDILDGMTQEKAVYYPNKLGTDGYEPFDDVMEATYSKRSGERNRSIVLENDGSSVKLGVKHKSNITNTGVWLVSMFVSASKSADVNVNIKNDIDTDANYTAKINREPTHIFLPVTTNQIGRIGREVEVYSDNLKMKGDWIEISDLTIIQLSDVVKTYSQINARIGKLDGIHDKVYGHLSGYGAYLKDLWATRNANVAGTITAGDKDGFGASFYAGKIHKNILINSLGVNFLNKPIPALSSEISPFGVGNVYKSTSTPVKVLAQDKKWVENNLNKEVCFSVFVKADADTGVDFVINTYNGKVHKENIHPNDGWVRINTSLFLDKVDELFFEVSGKGYFTAPQLEFGDQPTLYQPTDSKLNYTDEYGAWFNRGGIGGTIQNPLLKLNEDGSIESQGDGFKINKDGSGHLAGGALTFDDKHVNISFDDSNIGAEVDGAIGKLDKKIDDEVSKLETNFEIKEGQISSSVKEVREKAEQINTLGEEIKVVGEQASKDALDAKNSANAASKDAVSAKDKADLAAQKAIEAENKAKEALESAGKSSQSYLDAKKEAELAGMEADKASKDALIAKEKAELANSKATLAEREAARAKAEADRAASAKESVIEMDTSIKQTAEKIESTATQVEKKAGEATEASLKAESEAAKASKNAEDANNKALEATKKAEEALASAGASSQAYKNAKAEADKALKEAGVAADKAAEANKSALDAQNALATVTEKETNILQTAEKIESTAVKVESDANTASSNALKAQQEAEKSAKSATDAKKNATSAQTQAENAEKKALEAAKKAEEALASAGESSVAYINAKAEADKASKDAVLAKEQASLADKKAALAKSEADRAKTEADKSAEINANVTELNTQIQQTAGEIKTTATEVSKQAGVATDASNKAKLEADKASKNAASANEKALEATKKAEEALASAGASSQAYKDAKLEADKAVSEAVKASNKAAEANKSALDAKNSLENVTKKETAINQTADKIESTATIISGDAIKAKEAADLAAKKATEATTNAQTAKDKAAEAQLKAEEALKSAGESSQAYKNAKAEADKAVSEANKAANKANEANKSAQNAQNALNDVKKVETSMTQTAKEVNINAQKAVDSAGKAIEAEANINLKADGIVLEASEKSAQKAIDGLEIGVRNLVLNSNFKRNSGFSPWGNAAISFTDSGLKVVQKKGGALDGFYFSIDTSETTSRSLAITICVKLSSERNKHTRWQVGSKQATPEWDMVFDNYQQKTVVITDYSRQPFLPCYFYYRAEDDRDDDDVFYVKWIKIEEGNKPTPWTPAPEDMATVEETKAEFKVLSDKIESNVKKISEHDGKISKQQTQISQNAKDITSKASKTDVDNLTGRVTKNESSIKQSADKIESNIKAVVKAQGDADTAKGLAQSAQDSIDGLEIGGRNLVLNSSSLTRSSEATGIVRKEWNGFLGYSVDKINSNWAALYFPLSPQFNEPNVNYAFSVDMYYIGDNPIAPSFYTRTTGYRALKGQLKNNTWVRVYQVLKPTSLDKFNPHFGFSGTSGEFYFRNLKLEKGNKPTDWTPAPEDTEAQISELESSLTQTNNEIKGLVKKTDYDANNKVVNSKISEISQKSDKISLQVTEQGKKITGIDGRVKKTEIALEPDNIWLAVKSNTQKEIDGIEVGGRNIVLDSRRMRITGNDGGSNIIKVTNNFNLIRIEAINNKPSTQNFYNTSFADRWVGKNDVFYQIHKSEEFTLSMEVRYSGSSKMRMGFDTRNPNNAYYAKTRDVTDTGGKWVKIYAVKKELGRGINKQSILIGWFDSVKKGDFVEIRNIKLERGNKPTDWTPAPEDYSTTEEIVTSMKMTDKGFSMIGKEIDMTGGITFSMMKDGAGNTLIQGGKVKTDKLNVVDIVAKGIRTNHIEGLTLNFTKGKIGGWEITSSAITKNNVSLSADGSIQNGAKWQLKNDGSGTLASNNIKWDTAGNVTFSGNVKIGLGNLNNTITANNKIKTGLLNVNEIVTNGLTADHITGKNLNFKQGTIGGWEIKPTYLRSDKITLDPTGGIKNTSGMWEFNPDGTAKIGKNGVVELMRDEKAIVGGFAFVNSSLISRKGSDSNGYVSNKWQSYPNGGFSPYIMLNGITGEAFFKKSRIERSEMVDCFIEGAFLERMNNVYGYPSLLVPNDELLKDSTIDVSNGFNVNLFTREKQGLPLSNFFLLPDSLKNKYVGCTIRIQKYSEEADYSQDYDGWTNGNNLKPSNIPTTIKMNQHDIEGVVNRISVPDRGYIELTSVKRSDIDIVYPDGKTPPFEEQESVVVWRLSHISNEAKSYFGHAYIRHGEILNPVNMPLEKKQDYYIIPANILSSFGANVIEFNNFDDAVKYKIFGESGGSDMFYLHISGKRIDVYNGGNGYRRLNQWNGAIAFQTKGGENGFLVTRNIY